MLRIILAQYYPIVIDYPCIVNESAYYSVCYQSVFIGVFLTYLTPRMILPLKY